MSWREEEGDGARGEKVARESGREEEEVEKKETKDDLKLGATPKADTRTSLSKYSAFSHRSSGLDATGFERR